MARRIPVGLRGGNATGYGDAPMEPRDEQLTPALEQAWQRRKTLHGALVHLEEAISSPAVGRIPDWTARVLKDVIDVRDAFDKHIEVTERSDGLYDEIHERAPRLALSVQKLRDEHPEIAASAHQMAERLEQVEIGGIAWPLDDARDDLQQLIGTVIKHRQRGADLVWEAYNVDIGGLE
jgi:hypothetical protein